MYAQHDREDLDELKALWDSERRRIMMLDVYSALLGGGPVKGVRTSRGYKARCLSGHSDSDPSLHLIDQGDDHFFVSFCCGQRGDAAALVRFAGAANSYPEALRFLRDHGLFSSGIQHAKIVRIAASGNARGISLRDRRVTGTYDYPQLDGEVAYRAVRIEGTNVETNKPGKTFELWHPGHDGESCDICTVRLGRLIEEAHNEGWGREKLERSIAYRNGGVTIGAARQMLERRAVPAHPGEFRYGADGIERIPYLLPEVREAAERGETIFFAEGEKKAEALRRVGFAATSAPSGAQWRMPASWAEHFRGARHVVILPDCDAPGRNDCARPRLAALRNQGIPTTILDLDPQRTDGYDIADWLQERHDQSHDQIREEFKRLWTLRLTPTPLKVKMA